MNTLSNTNPQFTGGLTGFTKLLADRRRHLALKKLNSNFSDKNGAHFVTITLPPKVYKRKALNQLKFAKHFVTTISANFLQKSMFIAELTEQGNIHFHGICYFRKINDDIKTCKIAMIENLKKFARFDIQFVKNLENTFAYLVKDIDKTMVVLEHEQIIFYYDRKEILEQYEQHCAEIMAQQIDFI